ncbi:MAG: response regulator [Candidatus Methanospirareceae archaeon]
MGKEKELKVLLVEDSEEDVMIIERALEKSALKNRLFIVRDGEEALDFLFNRGKYTDKGSYPKPDVILLDLRLPKLDGIEVLKRIKQEDELKDIPIIVLTTSERDEDIIKSYEEGVKGYIKKSVFIQKVPKMDKLIDALLYFI